jgi:hypothetical protein
MESMSAAKEAVREKVNETVEALPPQGLEELSRFVDALARKYQAEQKVIALGGLWEGTLFAVEADEVRALRRRFTDELADKL